MQNELRQANNLTTDQQLIVASLSMEVYLIYHGMVGPFVSTTIATFFRNEIEETYQDMKQKCTSVDATSLLDALHHLVLDTFSPWGTLNPFDPDALFRETDPAVKQQHIESFRQRIQLVPEELRDFLVLVGKFYYDIHDDIHENNEASSAWLRASEFWQKKLPAPLKVPFWNSFAWNVDVMMPLAGFSNPTEG